MGPYNFKKVYDKYSNWLTPNKVIYLLGLPIKAFLWLLMRQERFIGDYVDTIDTALNDIDDKSTPRQIYIVLVTLISVIPLILYAGPPAIYWWVMKKLGKEVPDRSILNGETQTDNLEYGAVDGTVDVRIFDNVMDTIRENQPPTSKYRNGVVDSKIKKHTFK